MSSDEPEYLPARATRRRYNDPSESTFWRWQRDPAVGFPQPILIGSRKFFRLADLKEFERRQQQKAG